MNNDLMTKLAVSKKIMDRHQEIPRSGISGVGTNPVNYSTPLVENYDAVPANYNIPQEYVSESLQSNVKQPEMPTQDRILNSKLPDEIKQLMIENPIAQVNLPGTTNVLTNEIIEGAQKLMGTSPKKQPQGQSQGQNVSGIDINMLKTMIRDTVRDTVRDVVREELSKSGMIVENEQKANEQLTLKVGKHIFEGKVTKIKKIE
jgi:hypothetical protein